MENILKNTIRIVELQDDAHRQLVDSRSVFTAWEEAKRALTSVSGGIFWASRNGAEYLIRTSVKNAQTSLGRRSETTEKIYQDFTERKERAKERFADLSAALERHRRMNRALSVGRTPKITVEILKRLEKEGLAEYFTIVGTHSLFAYETAAGVRIEDPGIMVTQDIDLLFDVRKHLTFISKLESAGSTFLQILRKVDRTFEIRPDARYTAVNSSGFEVDIMRKEKAAGNPPSVRLSKYEENEFYIEELRAGTLLDGPRFSSIVVASNGDMARMHTLSPVAFVRIKRWMSHQEDRNPCRRKADKLQADLVENLVEEYLPNLNHR